MKKYVFVINKKSNRFIINNLLKKMNVRTVLKSIIKEKKNDEKELDFIVQSCVIEEDRFPKIKFRDDNCFIHFESDKYFTFYSRSFSKKVKLIIIDEDSEVFLILFYGDSKIQCQTITNKIIYYIMYNCNVERSYAIILLLENCLDFTTVVSYYNNKNKLKKYWSV